MVDATIIEQAKGSKNDEGQSTRDQDASFTKKHGTTYHGYKAHIGCDFSEIVTDYRFTTAKEHDSKRIDKLTEDEDKVVLADRCGWPTVPSSGTESCREHAHASSIRSR